MARYINATAFEEDARLRLCKDCISYDGYGCRTCWVNDMLEEIKEAPTTDVVPRAEVAREICCEIEEEIVAALESNYKVIREHHTKHFPNVDGLLLERIHGKIDVLRGIEGFVEELKNKYT